MLGKLEVAHRVSRWCRKKDARNYSRLRLSSDGGGSKRNRLDLSECVEPADRQPTINNHESRIANAEYDNLVNRCANLSKSYSYCDSWFAYGHPFSLLFWFDL